MVLHEWVSHGGCSVAQPCFLHHYQVDCLQIDFQIFLCYQPKRELEYIHLFYNALLLACISMKKSPKCILHLVPLRPLIRSFETHGVLRFQCFRSLVVVNKGNTFVFLSCVFQGPNCATDVNECQMFSGTAQGCQNGATCFNTPGSFTYVFSFTLLLLEDAQKYELPIKT